MFSLLLTVLMAQLDQHINRHGILIIRSAHARGSSGVIMILREKGDAGLCRYDLSIKEHGTAKILDVLKKHDAPAAFFLVGNYIERNGDLVRRMVDEGHIVGNHTMHHFDMSKLSDKAAFTKELQDLETLFKNTTGKDLPKYYRPPQGIYSQENLQMAKELGYKTVFWSLAYVDWRNDAQPTKDEAFAKLLPRIHNGAVVLLHSTSATNAEILDELLTKWEAAGYRFASIDTLF